MILVIAVAWWLGGGAAGPVAAFVGVTAGLAIYEHRYAQAAAASGNAYGDRRPSIQSSMYRNGWPRWRSFPTPQPRRSGSCAIVWGSAILSKQMAALEAVAYIRSAKDGHGRGASTRYAMTKQGRQAYRSHCDPLHKLIDAAPPESCAH